MRTKILTAVLTLAIAATATLATAATAAPAKKATTASITQEFGYGDALSVGTAMRYGYIGFVGYTVGSYSEGETPLAALGFENSVDWSTSVGAAVRGYLDDSIPYASYVLPKGVSVFAEVGGSQKRLQNAQYQFSGRTSLGNPIFEERKSTENEINYGGGISWQTPIHTAEGLGVQVDLGYTTNRGVIVGVGAYL